MITLVYHKKFKKITEIIINCCIIAIAEVYNNEGYDEYNKQNFSSAINFYTEGILYQTQSLRFLHCNRLKRKFLIFYYIDNASCTVRCCVLL